MMQVAILAGGLGTRLGPLAASVPKAMVPVLGRPFLAHVIELLKERGLRRLLVLAGHGADQMERAFGDGATFGVQIQWWRDGPRLLGTGGALRNALSRLEDEFFVLYGDTYLDVDFGEIAAAFQASKKPALMTVFRNKGRFDASNVLFRNGKLLRYSKRDRTPDMEHIDFGLSVLKRGIVAELPAGVPLDLGDVYAQLVASGRMAAFEVFNRFYEIGTPAALAETEEYLRGRAG